jgi:hypothetical protein
MDLNKIYNSLDKASLLIKKKETYENIKPENIKTENIKTDYFKLLIYFGIILTLFLILIIIIIYIYNIFFSSITNIPTIDIKKPSITNIPTIDIKKPSITNIPTIDIKKPSITNIPTIDNNNKKSYFDFLWNKKKNNSDIDNEIIKDIDKYLSDNNNNNKK